MDKHKEKIITVWIQINCLNEALDIERTLDLLPKKLAGVDVIEILIVDDGSTDSTYEIAKTWGVKHIVRHAKNRGLPSAVNTGVRYAMQQGADILINFDADGQYDSNQIQEIIQPLLDFKADYVYGERSIDEISHFSNRKKFYQKLGAKIISVITGYELQDATSGFRAINREAMRKIYLLGEFASPLETIIQASYKKLEFTKISAKCNLTERPSRIVKSNWKYILRSSSVIIENLIVYRSLHIFLGAGFFFLLSSIASLLARLYLVTVAPDSPHMTILIISIMTFTLGVMLLFFGLAIRLVRANKLILEELMYRQDYFKLNN